MDGTANGRQMYELWNWTGKAYKIPRTSYKKTIRQIRVKNLRVYFIFGYDDDNGKPLIYMEERENAIKRLGEHIKDEKKDSVLKQLYLLVKVII